jgi:hypothetical protein
VRTRDELSPVAELHSEEAVPTDFGALDFCTDQVRESRASMKLVVGHGDLERRRLAGKLDTKLVVATDSQDPATFKPELPAAVAVFEKPADRD